MKREKIELPKEDIEIAEVLSLDTTKNITLKELLAHKERYKPDVRHTIDVLMSKVPKDTDPTSYLSTMKELDLSGASIKDLSPLSHLVSLESLNLSRNFIEDTSPLTTLTMLRKLELNDNRIRDITPLAPLKKLDTLLLDRNQIDSIDALVALKNLRELSLRNNRIEDMSSLDNITGLDMVWIDNDQRIMLVGSNHLWEPLTALSVFALFTILAIMTNKR